MLNFWVCANCGYRSRKRFCNDICPHCGLTNWHCTHCGFTLTASVAPSKCIECGMRKSFMNITGYVPDWHPIETDPGCHIPAVVND